MAPTGKTKKDATGTQFVFRKHDRIGAADATEDRRFLVQSFIDNGELERLRDAGNPQSIVVGRTGSGKTALLEMIETTQDRVIKIAPEGLALTYVSNSDVLRFFIEAGVNMDLFYRLLWRHVFTVEIIKERYQIVNEKARDNFLIQVKERFFQNRAKQEAINYLVNWGEQFWKESYYRIEEITSKMVNDLKSAVGGKLGGSLLGTATAEVNLNAEAAKSLSEEIKAEIVRIGQPVVDRVQIKLLSDVIKLLDSDLLDDRQKIYYITIDRLDENWVNDDMRYHLIRALLETVRHFNNEVRNVKIIVALREDLVDRVFRYTQSPGYQEEKYTALYLPVTWQEDDLERLLDQRVKQLVKERYTTQPVGLRDLLPRKTNKRDDSVRYILSRTLLRPRDAIMFFNEIIRVAENRAHITQTHIFNAEAIYSESRLTALTFEWISDYQNLRELAFFLRKYPSQFRKAEIRTNIENCMMEFLIAAQQNNSPQDCIYSLVDEKFNKGDIEAFIDDMMKILFRVGIIGIKPETYSSPQWSYLRYKLMMPEIREEAVFYVHPAFWRVLGIHSVM